MEKSYRIRIEPGGAEVFCKEHQVVYDAVRQAGSGLAAYGCGGGGCGICRMQLLTGTVEIVKRMSRAHVTELQQQNGMVLLCCIEPRSDLVLAEVVP